MGKEVLRYMILLVAFAFVWYLFSYDCAGELIIGCVSLTVIIVNAIAWIFKLCMSRK